MNYFNNIKKYVFLGTLAVGFAFFGIAQAQSTTYFNTNPGDLATVKVMNVTNNPNSTSAWYGSVSADPGDTIAVRVYYHNTGPVAAQNTTVRMSPQSTGAVHSQTFFGSVTASNCTNCPQSGSASVSINGSQAQTLTYVPGSAVWYAEHSTYGTPLSANDAAAIFGGGFNMGSIGPDSTCPTSQTFCHQGTVRAQFLVGNTPPLAACNINYFNASPTNVSYNGSSTLSWSVTGATSASISGLGNATVPSGTKPTGALQHDQTYTLTVHCQNGNTLYDTVSVNVGNPPACTATFSASSTNINKGDTTTLSWNTTNASSVSISPTSGNSHPGLSGSVTVAPTNTTTYTLTVNCNNGSTITRTVTVTVKQPQVQNCVINSFSAAPSTTAYGSPANLYWTTTNCDQVSITNLGSQMLSGSTSTGNLIATTPFTLTADGPGPTQTKTVTVYVTQQPSQGYCAITSFNASPSTVNSGGISTLTWATTNDCTNVSISSLGPVGTSGSIDTHPIYGTTTFTLSASILGGAIQTRTLVVNMRTVYQQTYACSDNLDNDGDGYVDMNDPGCSSPTDNDEYNQIINPPQTYACNDGRDNDYDGYVDMNDPGCAYPTDNDEYNYVQPPVSQLSVSTLVASGVGQTSANLNGYVSGMNYVCPLGGNCSGSTTASVWFQWGSTYSLGATTTAQTVYGNTSFSAPIYNLAPNTTYYFRAVASNGTSGTVYGNILSFRTQAQTNTDPIIIYTGGGGSGNVPLMTLTIESRYETYRPGDAIDYVVTYKNIAKRTTLRDVVVHIQLPENVTDVRNTRGEYSLKDNTVTVEVGTLNPQEEESFFIDGIVRTTAKNGDPLVASGTAAYVYGSNIQDDVVAYSIDTIVGSAVGFLGALALFGADGLFPNTLIGWLAFILIVILLIMLGRKVFAPTRFVKQVAPTHLPH